MLTAYHRLCQQCWHYVPHCTSWDMVEQALGHHNPSTPRTRYWSWSWLPMTAVALQPVSNISFTIHCKWQTLEANQHIQNKRTCS